MALDLFDCLIVAIVTYRCEVWGYEIEKFSDSCWCFFFSFYRFLLWVSYKISRCGIVGELGHFPTNFTVIKLLLKYWYRLIVDGQFIVSSLHLFYVLFNMGYLYFIIRNLLVKYNENSVWSNLCRFNYTRKVHHNFMTYV